MKKIIFLLCISASMGFTVAREKAAGPVPVPAAQKIERTYGYIETSSPQSYTITLH